MKRRGAVVGVVALMFGAIAVACGGGSSGGNATPAAPAAAVRAATVSAVEGAGDPNTAWKFEPAQITVQAGATVSFTNTGKETHTVTADDGSFDLGTIDPGDAKSQTFAQTGTFAYHCSLHPWMKGSVVVTAAK